MCSKKDLVILGWMKLPRVLNGEFRLFTKVAAKALWEPSYVELNQFLPITSHNSALIKMLYPGLPVESLIQALEKWEDYFEDMGDAAYGPYYTWVSDRKIWI